MEDCLSSEVGPESSLVKPASRSDENTVQSVEDCLSRDVGPESPLVEPASRSDEDTVQSVELPLTTYFLVSMFTFCVPLIPVLAEIGLYGWIYLNIPSPPLILWDWLGTAGMWIFLLPLAFIGFLTTYIVLCVTFTTSMIHRWNRKSAPVEGVFSRRFTKAGVIDKRIHYYHLRGFAIKWPMWVTSKSPFPWVVNWCLQRNDDKLGKDVIFDNSIVPLELTEIGDDVYFGPGSCIETHMVNAIFGELFIGRIKVGSNVTVGNGAVVCPSAKILPHSVFLPNTFVNARWYDRWGTLFYNGTAARPIPQYSGMKAISKRISSEPSSPESPQDF